MATANANALFAAVLSAVRCARVRSVRRLWWVQNCDNLHSQTLMVPLVICFFWRLGFTSPAIPRNSVVIFFNRKPNIGSETECIHICLFSILGWLWCWKLCFSNPEHLAVSFKCFPYKILHICGMLKNSGNTLWYLCQEF